MGADFIIRVAALPQGVRIRDRRRSVVFRQRMHPRRCRRPFPVQAIGDRLFVLLVAAVVAEENDVAKAVQLKTSRGIFEYLLKCLVWNAYRTGKAHVRRRRADAAFRHVGHHRCHQCVAKRKRNFLGQNLDPDVMLAEHHVRPVLLGASDRNDDRPPSGADLIPELARGQLIEKHRLRRLGERWCRGQQQDNEQVPHKASNHGRILWDSWPIRQALRIVRTTTLRCAPMQ